jgi:hypothetical protein
MCHEHLRFFASCFPISVLLLFVYKFILFLLLGVIATFWPNEEMGRNQDGLGGYICSVLLDRPCAWIWAKLPVYLYIIVDYDSV